MNRASVYLVSGQSRRRQPDMISAMANGTDIALRMEAKYHIKHFLLERPKLIRPADCVIEELRKTQHFKEDGGSHPFATTKIPDQKLKDGFAIQKNAIAPEPHIIVPKSNAQLVNFMRDSVRNKKAFASELTRQLRRAWTMVQHETCLAQDFQLLLDAAGTLYNLDFDRCAEISAADLKNETVIGGKLEVIDKKLQKMASLVSKHSRS